MNRDLTICPRQRVEQLAGALVAQPEFRNIARFKSAGNVALSSCTAETDFQMVELHQLASQIFGECFNDPLDKLAFKYADFNMDLSSEEDWLLLGKYIIDDLFAAYQEYVCDPDNDQIINKFIDLSEPKMRRLRMFTKLGSRNKRVYERRRESILDTLFIRGIYEGVRTTIAYYEVASQLVDDSDQMDIDKAIRRLVLLHSGVDVPTNKQILEKSRRSEGDCYDNLLLNPEKFEVYDNGARKDIKFKDLEVESKDGAEDQLILGCPAYSHGVITRICKIIEIAKQPTIKTADEDILKEVYDQIPVEYLEAYEYGFNP